MTVRERFHQLIEELPEGEAETYLAWIENARNHDELSSSRVLPEDPAKAWRSLSQEERERRVRSVMGKYAHLPGSVDDFIRRKQEDIALEDAKMERRWNKE